MAETVSGVLKLGRKHEGELRDPARSFRPSARDVRVPRRLVQRFGLVEGATVFGPVACDGARRTLKQVWKVCGLPPAEFQRRTPYQQLTVIDPHERFDLSASGIASMRIVDLVAPIGKGTRGLIVSPAKAGKTTLLQEIAKAIRVTEPQTRIIVLLVDERPEEVTMFRRAVDAEVLASSNDQSVQEHVELSELTLAHIRTELECGRDVVVLVDSLTRMGRAFNTSGVGQRGRTMSGGVDVGALEIPRRFFGFARKIENGGSVTIIATVLVNTGSRMDQLIFEEFKGTGNSEIVLDRRLAEARTFPAINLAQTGTRKDELLYDEEEFRRVVTLRKALAGRHPREAIGLLGRFLEKYPTNEDFLKSDFVTA